jgi:hypothetical protein
MRVRIILCLSIALIAAAIIVFQPDALRAAPATPAADPIYPDQRTAVEQAVFWMVREFQNDDGGYASFSAGANQAPSTIAGTLDAILAIAAAGYNPAAVFPGEANTPLGYLVANKDALVVFAGENGGQAGKIVLALTASAVDPRNFVSHNFVDELTDHLEPSGAYGVADPFKQSVAMLAVAAVGQPVPASAVAWLEDHQAASGSWDDGFGTADSADATAMAVMALLTAGQTAADSSVSDAVEFLADSQRADAGWAYGPGLPTSANSTALVIQALSALGENWYSVAGPWTKGGVTPLLALLSFQSASGAFQADYGQGPFDDFYATVQAIPAAAGEPFPLPARFEAANRGLSCLDARQDPATGGWASFAGSEPDASGTSRAIQAIAAAGQNPQAARWTVGGVNAVEALEALTPDYLSEGRGGRVGVVMQGVVAAGAPYEVTDFAGENLPQLVASYLLPTGEYDDTDFGIFAHAEAMLGLQRAGAPVAQSAVEFLLSVDAGNDWGDPDSNGLALQVLSGLPRGAPLGTLAALRATQTVDGGWGVAGGANPNSSSEVVQGLTSVGLNPFAPDWSRLVEGRITSAVDVVMAQQKTNGCWPNLYGPGDDPYSTTDAIILLAQKPGWGFFETRMPYLAGDSQAE